MCSNLLMNTKKNHCFVKNLDEFHIVIDIDRWTKSELNYVMKTCIQKGYFTNISNPRIEVWFLLHHLDLTSINNEKQNMLLSTKAYTDGSIEKKLQKLASFPAKRNKKNIRSEDFLPLTNVAIENSKKLYPPSRQDRWPQVLGTDIHKLIEKLLPDKK